MQGNRRTASRHGRPSSVSSYVSSGTSTINGHDRGAKQCRSAGGGRSRAAFPSKSHDGSHDGSTHAVRRTPVFGFRRGAADSRRDAIHESLSDELD